MDELHSPHPGFKSMCDPVLFPFGRCSPAFSHWLVRYPDAALRPLGFSREAELFALGIGGEPAFVVKQWKPEYPANAEAQYLLLEAAGDAGLPVPQPAACGVDREGHQILVTHYAGEPLEHACPEQIRDAAGLLLAIHCASPLPGLAVSPCGPDLLDDLLIRQFEGIGQHPDILRMLCRLQPTFPPPMLGVTHGDFHLGNFLIDGDRLTIADWTDARIADTRYDLAWATLLLWIYHGPSSYRTFLDAYRAGGGQAADLAVFESVAALRWLLLARTAPVPINAEWLAAADVFLRDRLADGP